MRINIVFFYVLLLTVSGCMNQPPAPIQYNHDKDFSNQSTSTTVKKKTITNKPIYENDENEIVRHEISVKDEELDPPTGFLQETSNKNIQKEEDVIVVPNAKLNVKETQPKNEKETQSTSEIKESPFIKPLDGKIIAGFGEQTPIGRNNGVNLAADAGTPVESIASGVVVYAGQDSKFGNFMIIKLEAKDDLYAGYANLRDMLVKKGAIVAQGEVIGHVGQTGKVQSPQLHFAIREGKLKQAVNPLKYLPNLGK